MSIRSRVGQLKEEQRGAALLIATLLLVVFMGAVAMAVDLGWIYLWSLRIQHGADAASLAGVIHVPDHFDPEAIDSALAAAATNGFVDSSLGGGDSVAVCAQPVDPTCVENQHQLRATITHDVNTFFLNVFGWGDITITRTAVAEYILPLPMGSPDNKYGNDPASNDFPNFWGNIHGYFTGRGMGDRYSSACLHWTAGSGCPPNPVHRDAGYLYGVEVGEGATGLSVELFDPNFTRGGSDFVLVGDQPMGSSTGQTTIFTLYGPDETPLDTEDGNEVLCVASFGPRDPYFDNNGDGQMNDADDVTGDGLLDWDDIDLGLGTGSLWLSMCPGTNFDRGPGIYPLRVRVQHPGGADLRGLNRWSARVSASNDVEGKQPRFYGLGDMSIYANVEGGRTEFYLAEVEELHRNKFLVIDLWDPGDAAGQHRISVVDPHDNTPGCTYTSTNSSFGGTLSQCTIETSNFRFNDHEVTIRVPLQDDYSCGSDCWWKIWYFYPDQAFDTTTWSARIEGNPVRLVE